MEPRDRGAEGMVRRWKTTVPAPTQAVPLLISAHKRTGSPLLCHMEFLQCGYMGQILLHL